MTSFTARVYGHGLVEWPAEKITAYTIGILYTHQPTARWKPHHPTTCGQRKERWSCGHVTWAEHWSRRVPTGRGGTVTLYGSFSRQADAGVGVGPPRQPRDRQHRLARRRRPPQRRRPSLKRLGYRRTSDWTHLGWWVTMHSYPAGHEVTISFITQSRLSGRWAHAGSWLPIASDRSYRLIQRELYVIKEGSHLFINGYGPVEPFKGKYAVKTPAVFGMIRAGWKRAGLGPELPYRPLRIELELTTKCNDMCPTCGMGALSLRDGRNLTDGQLGFLIRQFESIGLPSVAITGGEPLWPCGRC